jgi:hypothetical protein
MSNQPNLAGYWCLWDKKEKKKKKKKEKGGEEGGRERYFSCSSTGGYALI